MQHTYPPLDIEAHTGKQRSQDSEVYQVASTKRPPISGENNVKDELDKLSELEKVLKGELTLLEDKA
ncbi:MAG: hypothetical protein M1831_004240 [Alyxoria varia]|nr:MAG: hypothetical protein M1831_004240 [Alyxoria varia]